MIEKQELQLISATAIDELNWNTRHNSISQDLIKQLHKQHYQLHTLKFDFISVICQQKLFEN